MKNIIEVTEETQIPGTDIVLEPGDIIEVLEIEEAGDTFKCPSCGTKVLKDTGYCVKCKKKVKEAVKEAVGTEIANMFMDAEEKLTAKQLFDLIFTTWDQPAWDGNRDVTNFLGDLADNIGEELSYR